MKSIKFLSAMALMAVMASCSEDLPNPPSQSYPEPDGVFENSGLVISQENTTVNLKNDNEQNVNAVIGRVSDLVNFPEGYTLAVEVEVAKDNSFSDVVTISSIMQDSLITVNPDILNGAIQQTISKKPGDYKVPMRFAAYAVYGDNTKMRLGGRDVYFGSYEYNVTTLDPVKVIEENYYLVGSFCNWDITKAMKFTNTVAGANQYDNPQFSIKIDVTEAQANAGYKWMVIPESTYASKDYATTAYGVKAAEDGLSGVLTATDKQGESAGVITNNGPMLITINMDTDTYTVSYALDNLFAFSSRSNALALYTDNFINYTGVAILSTTFYIGQEASQSGILFKQDPKDTPKEDAEKGTKSGKLTSKSDGENLKAPLKGNHFYWVDVNLSALTYDVRNIATMQLVGDYNGWNTQTAVDLTPSKDFKTWTAKDVELGNATKINCNKDDKWTINWGGEKNTVVTGGEQQFNLEFNVQKNLPTEPGKYDVTVDFSVYPYTLTLTRK